MPVTHVVALSLLSSVVAVPAMPTDQSSAGAWPRFVVAATLIQGMDPNWSVVGLAPSQDVEVQALTRRTQWRPDAQGRWGPVSVVVRAGVMLRADDHGRIDGAPSRPLSGPEPTACSGPAFPMRRGPQRPSSRKRARRSPRTRV